MNIRVHKSSVLPVGEAVGYFTRLFRRDADNPEHYLRRAISLLGEDRFDLTMTDLDSAIRIAPADARLRVTRGWSYGRKGNFDKYIGDLNDAVRLLPQAAWPWSLPNGQRVRLGKLRGLARGAAVRPLGRWFSRRRTRGPFPV